MNLSLEVPAWVDLSKYTIEWTSSLGGTFTPANSKDVTFTPPIAQGQTSITVTISDACDRAVFSTQVSYVTGLLASTPTVQGKYVAAVKKVMLDWKRAEGVIEYVIERKNANGSFTAIGKLTDNNASKLYFEDVNLQAGVVNYRVQMVYFGGKKVYSNIIVLEISESYNDGIVSLINPAKGNISLTYKSQQEQVITMMLFDTNGKLLSKNTKAIEAGTHTLAVQPALKTGAGMYVLRIASNHTVETRKVYFIP